MLNLDLLGGISFTKGCYVGQEVVAKAGGMASSHSGPKGTLEIIDCFVGLD